MDKLNKQNVQALFAALKVMALANRDHLIKLDSEMGDGDLGLTMAAVFTAADQVAADYAGDDLGDLFARAGIAMSRAAPSTMGTLMATGFMRGGKAIKGATELDLASLVLFWTAFVDGMMQRGKAKPGEKTIIDALHPAAESLQLSLQAKAGLASAMAAARQAAADGVDATTNMVAQHGRAAYYQEKSRAARDPGATVGSLVISVLEVEIRKAIDGK